MTISLNIFQTTALALALYCLGRFIVSKNPFLQRCCIPAPVVGGLLFAFLHLASHQMGFVTFTFDETLKTYFMNLFFTGVGYTACFRLLRKGGLKVFIFLALATTMVIFQNAIGATLASLFNLDPRMGLAMGSIPMVGGHGTASSFGPDLERIMGTTGVEAVAVATATFGLVAGSLMGGPLGRSKINKFNLKSTETSETLYDTAHHGNQPAHHAPLDAQSFTTAFVLLAVATGLGTYITSWFAGLGITLPTYIGGMMIAVIVRNFCDFRDIELPAKAMDIWGTVSLTIFLSIALMTLKLWELAELAAPMMVILAAQTLLMFCFASFVVFRVMGKDYEGAVMTSAFCGFGMGATPNAMANMQAITDKYGPAPQAFFVVPIVGGMFIDFTNTAVILFFMNMLG